MVICTRRFSDNKKLITRKLTFVGWNAQSMLFYNNSLYYCIMKISLIDRLITNNYVYYAYSVSVSYFLTNSWKIKIEFISSGSDCYSICQSFIPKFLTKIDNKNTIRVRLRYVRLTCSIVKNSIIVSSIRNNKP